MMPRALMAVLALMTAAPLYGQHKELKRALQENWYIRATGGDSLLAFGRITQLDTTSVVIGLKKITITEISGLDHRLNTAKAPVKVGAVAGFFAGIVLGLYLCNDSNSAQCGDTVVPGAAVFGAGIGFLAAATGTMMAPGKYKWQKLWP
jgi:hypothetical protein